MNDRRTEATDTFADDSRRKFLATAGSLAAYTPPVILALMYPGTNAIASPISPNFTADDPGKRKAKAKRKS
jgi:hypothetical protein